MNRAPVETVRKARERGQAFHLPKTSHLDSHFSKSREEGEMWAEQRPAPPMSPAKTMVTQTPEARTTCTPGPGGQGQQVQFPQLRARGCQELSRNWVTQ